MSVFDDAVAYARDIGIPEDQIDEVVEQADLCCEGPGGNGVCAENTKAIIDSFAPEEL